MARFLKAKKEMIEELTRNNLYQAAYRIVTERGWDGLTMELLAKKAGMAKGTIYNYFKNKDEVVSFVIERMMEPLEEGLAKLDIDNGDPGALFMEMLDILTQDILKKSFIHSAICEAVQRSEGRFDFKQQKSVVLMRQKLAEIYARGVRQGIFRDVPPEYVVEFISSVMSGTGFRVMKGDLADIGDEYRTFINTTIMAGIRRG